MTALDKQAVLPAYQAAPPRYGLFVAAQELPATSGFVQSRASQAGLEVEWQNGTRWSPEQVLAGGVVALDCHGDTASVASVKTNVAESKADPFVVWVEDHCSTLGMNARDYEGRARRQLAATQSFRAASELWTGTLAQSATLDNAYLMKDPEVLPAGSTFDSAAALAVIEMGLAQMLGGRRGMAHVSPQVFELLRSANAMDLSGQLWVTPAGTIVVSDAGYPGTKPAAASSTKQWIYGTPMISYRLGDIIVTDRSAGLDRDLNLMKVYAERLVLLEWDQTIPVGNHSKLSVLAAETSVPTFAFTA